VVDEPIAELLWIYADTDVCIGVFRPYRFYADDTTGTDSMVLSSIVAVSKRCVVGILAHGRIVSFTFLRKSATKTRARQLKKPTAFALVPCVSLFFFLHLHLVTPQTIRCKHDNKGNKTKGVNCSGTVIVLKMA
jgi:hypothetical protein